MLDALVDHDVRLGDLALSGGTTLPNVVARVTLYGTPRDGGANVVFAPHALTGSSRVLEWWDGLAGPGRLFDPDRWWESRDGARVAMEELQRLLMDIARHPMS